LAAEILGSRRRLRLKALGTSMLPTVWPGDVLTIESAACEETGPGDTVLLQRSHRFLFTD
jgi:hypothetical protein